MRTIDVTTIETRKAEWTTVTEQLQKRVEELNDEVRRLHEQLAQLSGAIQACDVLLAGADVQPEVSTLDNNG